MALAIESQRQHFGYDQYPGPNSFSNPWTQATSNSPHYSTSLANTAMSYNTLPKPQPSMAYTSNSVPATSIPQSTYSTVPYGASDLLNSSQDLLHGQRQEFSQFTSAPSQSTAYSTAYNTYPAQATSLDQRRSSQTSEASLHSSASAYDALQGARAIANLSQSDLTPRGPYPPRGDRNSVDSIHSYGFPSSHSTHSSISYGSSPQYFAGSVNGDSATDYSSACESLDGMNSRTLPRPNLMGHDTAMPPNPQAMMGSFNSKISTSTQKKHKCKVCDKRFTRPSSLQTHLYSHTGEKPFSCDVPGCGRNFSVVSNLRRHRKVHRNDRNGASDHDSPEGSWASRE